MAPERGRTLTREAARSLSPELSDERWPEVSRLVDAALELPPGERDAFLAQACERDAGLRAEVEGLLAACARAERAEGFLTGPASDYAASLLLDLDQQAATASRELPAKLAAAVSGRYSIERELVRGGMATIFLARDDRHHRRVAIKVIRPELAASIGKQRFLREIQIAASLHHPHIVPLYDSGAADELLYFVMPYVEGDTLRALLDRERQIPVGDAVAIARDIAQALDHAHARGIVHRDIKPENVLLDGGHALLADFGVARAIAVAGSERLTGTGTVVGTPNYMSPEQAAADAHIDGRSDVYALGCIVYEMLAGEPPFTGSSPQAILAKHLHTPVPALSVVRPTISVQLQSAVETALAKVPADRYSSAGAFARALEGAALRRATAASRLGSLVATGTVVTLLVVAATLLSRGAASPPAVSGGATAVADARRIAVLYFDDRTPGRTLGHVASGLTEDLIDELSEVRALHVISPNGVRRFQATAAPTDSIARTLGVGTIIGGSIASAGQTLRVTVRLIDATTGEQLQSRTLERPSADLLTLQDSLTGEVAHLLRERLGREIRMRAQRTGTKSVRAWETVQQAEELTRQASDLSRAGDDSATAARLWRADTLFERAERLDPTWTVPIIGRGWLAYSLAFVSGVEAAAATTGPRDAAASQGGLASVWIRRAIMHAEMALRLQPRAPEALALRGEMLYRAATFGPEPGADSLLPLAEADLRATLDARPDFARASHVLGELYLRQGRFSEAARALQNAYEGDAFLAEIRSVVALLFFASLHTERFEDARKWCRAGLGRYAGDPRFTECELTLLGWSGRERRDVPTAWRLVRDIEAHDSLGLMSATWAYRRMMVAALLARTGMRDSARAVLGRTRAEHSGRLTTFDVTHVEAYVRVLLDDREAAIRLLAAYLASKRNMRDYVLRTPWYRPLHTDPRFLSLVRLRV